MTKEEQRIEQIAQQRIEQIEQFASQCYEDGERYSAFISGAIWADDNPAQDVVILNYVWHDAREVPQCEYEFICQDTLGNVWLTDHTANETGWEERAIRECIARWAYVKDLLPKGGD